MLPLLRIKSCSEREHDGIDHYISLFTEVMTRISYKFIIEKGKSSNGIMHAHGWQKKWPQDAEAESTEENHLVNKGEIQ